METSERIALYAIVFNLSLVLFKYFLAIYSGSLALKAEVIHSLTDVITSLTILVGIKLSKRKSPSFPYGLYKVENLVSLGVSLLIVAAGVEIVKVAFGKAVYPHIPRLPLTVGGVGLGMLGAFFFSGYEYHKGRELNSPSLISDAQHLRSDVLSALAIMAGLIGEYLGFRLDRVVASLVAIFIVKAGIGIFIDSIKVLLDASVDFSTLDRVKTIVLSFPAVEEVKAIWGRSSGRYKFIELVITLKIRDLQKAHFISQQIEKKIKEEISHVDHVLIHYEPKTKEFVVYAVPLNQDRNTISDHFGDAPYFYFCKLKPSEGKIYAERIELNPYASISKGKGIRVSKWLLTEGVDVVLSKMDLSGRGPFFVLSEAGVTIEVVPFKTLTEAKEAIINLREPSR